MLKLLLLPLEKIFKVETIELLLFVVVVLLVIVLVKIKKGDGKK